MARSLALARFGGCSTLSRWWGYYGAHVRALIWRLSFAKMLSSIFFSKMRPKSVLAYRRKQPLDRIRGNQPKNQRVGTSGYKTRGPGACPWCSFLRLSSKESRAPPPESAGNPRCRVHPATVPTEPPTDNRGPGPLSPHFSGEMGTPAGQAGQRGAAPQGCFRGTHPKGTPPGPLAHKIFHRMEIPYVFHRNPPQWGAHRHRAD